MKLLLSGFLPRDEMAFDLFLKRFKPTWRWHGQPANPDHVLASADLLVIDLAAHGWSQCNDVTLEELVLTTGNTVAILLMPPNDNSWQSASASHYSSWVWLSKPYNAAAMREALSHAVELVQAQQQLLSPMQPKVSSTEKSSIATAAVTVPEASPRLRSVELPDQAVSHAVSAVTSAAEQGMNTRQLAEQLEQYPAGHRVLLRLLLAGLQSGRPFEVRFTMQHFLIFHPADDWVASNTPMPVMQRVAGSDALAASVSLRELAPELVEDRLHQLGAVPLDLSDFLLQLVTPSFLTARSSAAL